MPGNAKDCQRVLVIVMECQGVQGSVMECQVMQGNALESQGVLRSRKWLPSSVGDARE